MNFYKENYFKMNISGIVFYSDDLPKTAGMIDLQFLNDIQDILKISMSYNSRHT